MRSQFTVITPAPDATLLTIEQLRIAAGLASNDSSQDTELTLLGKRISAEIAAACRIRGDGVHPPTLRLETIRETFRERGCEDTLFLSRAFITAIDAVTDAGNALVATDYDLDAEAALLQRISGTCALSWLRGDAVIEYRAGFVTVPDDLAGAAMDLVRFRLSSDSRDPLVKGETIEIPDVRTVRQDYWVGSVPGSKGLSGLPADIFDKLGRFMNVVVA